MKTKYIIILGIIVSLFSCTEEGPFTMGKLECTIVESEVTPTTALVTVSYAQNELIKEMGNITIVDKPLEYGTLDDQILYQQGNFNFKYPKLPENQKRLFFTDLTPNTTYYVIAHTDIDYNDDNEAERDEYYTGLSFKTAQDGDFSCFGKATYDLISETTEMVKIKVNLPQGLKFYGSLYVSENEDISNPIKFESISPDFSDLIFTLYGLEQKKYYLQLRGYLQSSNIYDYWNFSDGYIWGNVYLDFQKPLNLSE